MGGELRCFRLGAWRVWSCVRGGDKAHTPPGFVAKARAQNEELIGRVNGELVMSDRKGGQGESREQNSAGAEKSWGRSAMSVGPDVSHHAGIRY